MSGINARANIAPMKDTHSGRNGATKQLPCHAICPQNLLPIPRFSVSSSHAAPNPQPASAIGFRFGTIEKSIHVFTDIGHEAF